MPNAGLHHTRLNAWYHICADSIVDMPCELTIRQWAILTHIYLIEDTHTVKSLAYTFDIPKPAVCRALDTLCIMKLVRRRKDRRDRRNVIVYKTMQGITFLNQFSDILEKNIPSAPKALATDSQTS